MNSREKCADILIVYSISIFSHLIYLLFKCINIFINTFPVYNATSRILTRLVPTTDREVGGDSRVSFCAALYSLPALSPTSLHVVRTCPLPASSGSRKTDVVVVGPRGPQRTVPHFCVFIGVSQYCPSHLVHQVHSYSYFTTHFRQGKLCCSLQEDGDVFSSCVLPLPVCQGQPAGCLERMGVLVRFEVNFICHQRKDTSHSAKPLAIKIHFQLGQIYSLLYGGRRVNVSLGLGPFILFLFLDQLATGPQANRSYVFKRVSKRLTNKPKTPQVGFKETLTWILRQVSAGPLEVVEQSTDLHQEAPSSQHPWPHHSARVPSPLTSEGAPSSDLRCSLKDALPKEPGPGTHLPLPCWRSVSGQRDCPGGPLRIQRPYQGGLSVLE